MADTITKAVREDNSDASVNSYHISYEVEDGGDKNQFVIVIKASEMTLDTDVVEAKTLANVKAAAIKSAWVTSKATSSTNADEASIEGAVTL